jgi:excinuclease UvrABC nuclease subunit
MNLKDLIKTSKLKKVAFEVWDHAIHKNDHEIHLASNKLGGGIYRMYNKLSQIIYVGKSNDIHRRLLQHIGKRSNTAYFIDEVDWIEYHVNDDPVFQTMLEGIFIAFHAPKYNDEVKDRSAKE